MSLLTSVHEIEKHVGDKTLFSQLSFGIHEEQKIGLLGPNGSGKSTLLKILTGLETADKGEVAPKKGLKLAYVHQLDNFPENQSIKKIAVENLINFGLPSEQADIQSAIHLSMAGFNDFEVTPKTLSGGWKKRLSLAIAFAKEPELLLLDEPTNHLDWDGIEWLEGQLKIFKQGFLMVSHDRQFLKNLCSEFMEVNPVYKDGVFFYKGDYEKFFEKKQSYLKQLQARQESLSNKARRELEWLRAGVQARTTKSQGRIKEAHKLFDVLEDVKSRNSKASQKMNIKIESAGKKSKKLIELKKLDVFYPEKEVALGVELLMGPGMCLGVLGDNGSGKTSLLRVIAKQAVNFRGQLFHADDLKIVYFDQKRESLNPEESIFDFLGDGSDHVSAAGKSVHVAAYASQFRFENTKLNQPIHKLSGGEQARLLIAKLLLQPADLLILDEPTNDLDIDTIEILEKSLLAFPGAALVVSHDRQFLKNTCNRFLALNGRGGWLYYADLNQWLSSRKSPLPTVSVKKEKAGPKIQKVKLSYKEKRQWESIEEELIKAEEAVISAQEAIQNNTDFDDHEKIKSLTAKLSLAEKRLNELYETWEELDKKVSLSQS